MKSKNILQNSNLRISLDLKINAAFYEDSP